MVHSLWKSMDGSESSLKEWQESQRTNSRNMIKPSSKKWQHVSDWIEKLDKLLV